MKYFFFYLLLISSFTITSQNNITICWDTSLSMKDRVIESEINFLDHYFSSNEISEAVLILFSNNILEKENYSIIDGNWTSIKDKLQSVSYDGATSYKQLPLFSKGEVLLFTDGFQNYDNSIVKFDAKLKIINSNSLYNERYLQRLAQENNGDFINLIDSSKSYNTNNKKTYKGNVYSENDIISNVLISIKNSDVKSKINENGAYQIKANPGDVLVFSYYGKEIAEKELEENVLNDIWLTFDGEMLEEVVISGKNNKNKEEEILVQTATGKQNKDKVGHAVQTIESEEITNSGATLTEALEDKVVGLEKGSNQDISQSVIRGISTMYGNNYALIVIDGAPIARSSSQLGGKTEITDFININNIAEVTVLKGFAATNIYGSEGSNGVILITTKTNQDFQENKETRNTALVKNNVYSENLIKNTNTFTTPYLKELNKETSVIEAYKLYLTQRRKYWDNPFYFIDIFNFFKDSNKGIAYIILSNTLEQENSSITTLQGALLTSDFNKNYPLSLIISEFILEKFPNKTQSYLNVALANKNTGNYQESANMLLGILNGNINRTLDFTGLRNITENELKNLIATHKKDINLKRIPLNYQKETSLDIRIIFSWNNPEAEFELQFVNPSKRFFNWEHTRNNPERIEDELKNGYSQEQFEIDGGEKGEWICKVFR